MGRSSRRFWKKIEIAMIIGFDGKRAVQNFTGLGNYSRFVIGALNRYHADNQYKIFAPKRRNNREFSELLHDNTADFYPQTLFAKLLPSVWRSTSILSDLKREDVKLFHGLSGELPFGINKTKIKSIVTIHDLIFLRYPQYYKAIDRKIYDYKYRRACIEADAIIAVSDCTKRDIVNYYNIPEEKITTIYQGCHPLFTKEVSEDKIEIARKRYNLPKRYIVCVGTIEERKNLMLLAEAMKDIPNDVHLVAVGRKTEYAGKVEEFCNINNLTDRVHLIEVVPFDLLPALYQGAEIFAYPSRFEGFGIPIVEAISLGLTGMAASGSCLEEAGGDGILYVNPDSPKEAADALNRLLSDKNLRNELIEKGKKHIQNFTPEKIASDIAKLYNTLL